MFAYIVKYVYNIFTYNTMFYLWARKISQRYNISLRTALC